MDANPTPNYCIYDNPESLRREQWVGGQVTYSVCVSVVKSAHIPPEFRENWSGPWQDHRCKGFLGHLPDRLREKVISLPLC